MRRYFWITIFFIMLVDILGSREVYAQSGRSTLIPEFYGIYLVADGKLKALEPSDVGFGNGHVGLQQRPKTVVKDKNAYFIVYQKNIVPTNIGLAQLKFLDSDVVKVSPLPGWKSEEKLVTVNAWVLEGTISLNVAPIEGKMDMYRLVPTASLTPGVYAIPSGLFGKLGLTDRYGAQLEVADRAQRYGANAFAFILGEIPLQIAETVANRPSSSIEIPQKATIDSITKNIPDTNFFEAKTKILNASFDIVWNAANRYFAQSHKIAISDPIKGTLLTEPSIGMGIRSRGSALIEKVSESTTNLTVKVFCYKESGRRWLRSDSDFCSNVALRGIEKEIQKQHTQQ